MATREILNAAFGSNNLFKLALLPPKRDPGLYSQAVPGEHP